MIPAIRTLIRLSLVASLAVGSRAGTVAAQVPGVAAPSETEARQLEQQVRAWLSTVAGGLPVAANSVTFTPDGDGYRITVPLGTLPSVSPKDAMVTMRAHRLDATRWAIDDQQLPPDIAFTVQQPVPNATVDNPDAKGTHAVAMRYALKVGTQTSKGVFDPTYATPTSTQGTVDTIDLVQTGGAAGSISHFGGLTSTTTLTPTGPGRIDMVSDSVMQSYDTKREIVPGMGVTMSMERVHLVSVITGFAAAKWGPLAASMVQALQAEKAAETSGGVAAPAKPVPVKPVPPGRPLAGKPPAPAPAKPGAETSAQAIKNAEASEVRQKAMVRSLLVAAHDLLTGGRFEQTAEAIKFEASGHTGAVAHAAISFAGDAPQDMLTASMGLTLDGLVVDELPPAIAAYVPSHFMIHPTVSNLNVATLTQAAMNATAPGGSRPDADLEALFAKGGINFGFDAMALDVGETKFSGTGSFNAAGPQSVTGQAEFSATGFDALITKAQADPLMQQALPFAIFLKGIAKINADRATWLVTVANGKALVNGVDLSALAGR